MTTRVLKVYNGSTLIETFTLGTDIGHYLAERNDVRNELRTIETVDTRYYKEIYRPTYKFTFNNVTLADIINMFAHEILFYSFFLIVDGFEYQVVPMASTLNPYHPAISNSQWVVEFVDIHQYDVPRLDILGEYDFIYQNDNQIGLTASSEMTLKFLCDSSISMINVFGDTTADLVLTHTDINGADSQGYTLKDSAIVSIKPQIGINILKLKSSVAVEIEKLFIWGM